jgi:hypothetical protein
MVNDNQKVSKKYESCYQAYIKARDEYFKAISPGGNRTKEQKSNYDKARGSFYESIVAQLLQDPSFSDLLPFKTELQQLLNHLWITYFQEIDIFTGKLHPIADYNHLKELQDEVKGFDELREFLKFNLDNLRSANFPIDIKYNGKILASIKSIRIWHKMFEILEREMIYNRDYTFSIYQGKERYLTGYKSKKPKNPEDVVRVEMAESICDFLNVVPPFKRKAKGATDKQANFIAKFYTLLKMPMYNGHKLIDGTYEKHHIHGYLKNYQFKESKARVIKLQYGL